MSGPLRRPQPALWWTKRGAYFLFMMRELSSLFIGIYVVLFLILLYKVSKGHAAYYAYLNFLWSRPAMVFHLVALGFSLLHAFTWFNAAPKAMVVWRGEEKLPPAALIAPNYVAWLGITGVVLWMAMR